ncbi:hypothetical protein K4F52_005116 [Lecanicillium sp. MT-2017a]|nr:hypothetical protein K4F52_005116 [Lecanicillium sp. MT-2017a]
MAFSERLSAFAAALKLVLLLLEEIPKRGLIVDEKLRKTIKSDALSGFWGYAFFVWSKKALSTGFRDIIALEDLPDLPENLASEELTIKFRLAWARGFSFHHKKSLRLTHEASKDPSAQSLMDNDIASVTEGILKAYEIVGSLVEAVIEASLLVVFVGECSWIGLSAVMGEHTAPLYPSAIFYKLTIDFL